MSTLTWTLDRFQLKKQQKKLTCQARSLHRREIHRGTAQNRTQRSLTCGIEGPQNQVTYPFFFFWKWFTISIGSGNSEAHFLKMDTRVHFLDRFLKMWPNSSSAALNQRRTNGRGWLPSLSMMPGPYFAQSLFFFFFLIFLTSRFLCQVLWRFSDIRKLCPDSSTLCWCSYILYNKAKLSIKQLLRGYCHFIGSVLLWHHAWSAQCKRLNWTS